MTAFVDPVLAGRRDAVWAIMKEISKELDRIRDQRNGHVWEIDTDYTSIVIRASPELTEEEVLDFRNRYSVAGSPNSIGICSDRMKDDMTTRRAQ